MKPRAFFLLMLLPFLFAFSIKDISKPVRVTVNEIINGHTFKADFPDGTQGTVSVIGIHTPTFDEVGVDLDPLQQVITFATDRILGAEVWLSFDEELVKNQHKDRNGNLLAHIILPDGSYYGELVLRMGFGNFNGSYNFDSKIQNRFKHVSNKAKKNKIGFWKSSLFQSSEAKNPGVAFEVKITEILEDYTCVAPFIDGSIERIKIIGINSKNICQKDYSTVKPAPLPDRLTKIILEKGVKVSFDPEHAYMKHRDKEGNLIAHILMPDGSLLGWHILEKGLARYYGNHPFNPDIKKQYIDASKVEKQKNLGFWAECKKESEKNLHEIKRKYTSLKDSYKKRLVDVPKRPLFNSLISYMTDIGYSFLQADPISGMIITDWKIDDPFIANLFMVNLFGTADTMKTKLIIGIQESDSDKSLVILNISHVAFVNDEVNSTKNVSVSAKQYQDVFEKLGEELGISFKRLPE